MIFSKEIYHKVKENIDVATDFNTTLIENVNMNYSIKNLNLVKEFIYRIENKLIIMLKSNFSFISFLNIIELVKNFIYEIGLFIILVGHFLKNQSDKVVIIMHGFGSDWIEMDGYAKMFYKRNFNVLAVSARAHGESEGDMVGMGWLDRLDLLRWIEFANEKVPNARIVLFGVSMGASAVCMSLGEKMQGNVVCAIEDCGFDNVFKEICYVYRKKLKFTSTLLFKIFYKWTKRARGFDLKKGDAVKALKKAKTPVLFIHGGDDTFVPTQMVYNLYEALGITDKRLYICEGATHAKSFQTDEARYEMKVDKFLTKHGL